MTRMRFRKKPVEVEASKWNRNGDHPDDGAAHDAPESGKEGLVVRRYRRPGEGTVPCSQCGIAMFLHGWIDTLEGEHIVCPGDWIITGVKGERYPCKPDIFAATYEMLDGSKVAP